MKKSTLVLALTAIFISPATFAQDASFDMTNITINNVGDESGLEMGDGSHALGLGSIATGKNSIAIGKNAVSTGGNETLSSISEKLAQNKQKLADIATAEANTNHLLDELQSIRKAQADVIEAGERVKQVRLAKQSAYNVWQEKLKTYNDTVASSTQVLQEAQAKIDDLNSRLTGVSRIGGIDISSDEGLTNAATQLKSIAEENTTLNLSVDFYRDYVKSYYQALGDIRQKEITYESFNKYSLVKRNNFSPSCSIYSCIDGKDYINEQTKDKIKNKGINPFLNYVDFDTSIISQQEWDEAQKATPVLKELMVTYYADVNEPFVTEEILKAAVNYDHSVVDIYLKRNEIAYYQGQYEATKNTSWLDKKAKALNEFTHLEEQTQLMPNPLELKRALIEQWYADNITAIKERNIITTKTLTSELEKALGINKNAIEEKQAQITHLKTEAEQAKSTYDNTNPSDADLALSERYEQVIGQLTAKANELKSEQEHLQALRNALTLHDLTNVGENAYAIGTNALATGTNSFAIGTDTISTGENSIALGNASVVTGKNSIAIGTNNHVLGNNTFVLGSNVLTTSNNAVVLGANSADGGDNTVSVGSSTNQRKIVYVADGDISATSKDAINGSQVYDILNNGTAINVENWKTLLGVGSTENGNTATANQVYNTASDTAKHLGGKSTVGADGHISSPTYSITDIKTGQTGVYNSVGSALQTLDNNTKTLTSHLGKMSRDIQSLHGEVQTLRKDAFAGTASAMAIAGLGQSTQAGKTSVSMSGSAYRGENAYAIGVSRLSDSGNLLLKGAMSGNSRGHYGGVVSATYTFN